MREREPKGVADAEWNSEEFVCRLQQGDQSAYAELVRGLGPRMMASARRMLGEEDAQDAVQDAFVSVLRSIKTFENRSLLSTWVHRVVVNAALTQLRKRKRKGEVSIEEVLPRFGEDGHRVDPEGPWPSFAPEDYESVSTRRLVRDCIDRLPVRFREILVLRDLEGLDTAETAEMLAISEANTKVRLHRARQALRQLLTPHMTEMST